MIYRIVMITDWSSYSSPSLPFIHFYISHCIDSSAAMRSLATGARPHSEAATLSLSQALTSSMPLCSVATVMLSPHTIISHRPSCDPVLPCCLSLSYVMSLSLVHQCTFFEFPPLIVCLSSTPSKKLEIMR